MIESRNLKWANAEHSSIVCEINHPSYGWIPYSTSETDIGIGHEIWDNRETLDIEEYVAVTITVTPEQRISEIQDAVQNLLDSKAREKMYDSALSIATYAISSDEIFKAEADAFVVWRDRCWRKCYDILAQFQSGEIEMPSVENVIEQLPTFDWDSLEISQ